jgi:plastocyanin
MKREFVILLILFSVFLAIGCAGNNAGQTPNSTGAPAATSAKTPVPAKSSETSVAANSSETPANSNSSETPAASAGGKTIEISIQGFTFNPSSITISPGDTVRWTNMDSATHTVVGDSISSGNLKNGDTYKQTFTKPGTYNYQCSIHPSMKGMIIVKE